MTTDREALQAGRDALAELTAMVRGECPSLLNEDSGGNARLDLACDAALAKIDAALASERQTRPLSEVIAKYEANPDTAEALAFARGKLYAIASERPAQPLQLPPLTEVMYHACRGNEYEFTAGGPETITGYLDDSMLDEIWEQINTALRCAGVKAERPAQQEPTPANTDIGKTTVPATVSNQAAPAPTEQLARFGHHPDAVTDFCVEVEAIEAEVADLKAGLPPTMDLGARIFRAMTFKAGVVPEALAAKNALRAIEAAQAAPAPEQEVPAFEFEAWLRERDAARYRWLRDQWDRPSFLTLFRVRGGELDAAIDSAIAAKGQTK